MEDDFQNNDANEVEQPAGVPTGFAVFAALLAFILAGTAGYFVGESTHDNAARSIVCAQSSSLSLAQMANQTAQYAAETAQRNAVTVLQTAAMKACIDKGGMPQFVGGNATCSQTREK